MINENNELNCLLTVRNSSNDTRPSFTSKNLITFQIGEIINWHVSYRKCNHVSYVGVIKHKTGSEGLPVSHCDLF